MRAFVHLTLVLAALALASSPAPSLAATPEETARARELFQKGQIHFDLGEYPQALAEFKAAYQVIQDPILLFNIGQCHYKLGQNREALDLYRRYLHRVPKATNRAVIEQRIQELERAPAAAPPPPAPSSAPTSPPTTAAPAPLKPIAGPEPAPPSAPRFISPGTPPRPTPAPVEIGGQAPPPADARPSLLTRWWFWAGVGAVVIGGVAIGVAASRRGEIGDCMGVSPCRTVGK